MITSSAFAGKRYAVLGLARSGAATVEALLASGAKVTAWDRQDDTRAPFEGRCELADPLEIDLTGYDGVVVAPGVPLNTHPIKPHAEKFGVPVIGDIELFALARADLPPHMVVGITGTNGKSTTTALVHHILKTAGVPTTMGGNIGLPILAQEPLPEGGVYVLELSSYQIDLTYSLDCDVAVLLNITPDHLDRYDGSFEKYAASKARLFEMQSPSNWRVLGVDDEATSRIADALLKEPQIPLSLIGSETDPDFGVNTSSEVLAVLCEDIGKQSDWPSLQGLHNRQNAAAAAVVCNLLNLDGDRISAALKSFKGLPHRMELVCEEGGVLYINDSKATNPDSTAPALSAYPPDPTINNGAPRVHWIVGGLPKEDGLGACEAHLDNITAAYTVGEAGPRFADLLEGRIPNVERCEMICEAVKRAREAARSGEVVLLSPACASFDQFRDYEKRGEHFRAIVGALAEGNDGATGTINGGKAA